ncbi:MAG: hypothetical protein IJI47_02275 [Eubacterium sp.]|nr:hypothetical protein [Eubacterium sp.]
MNRDFIIKVTVLPLLLGVIITIASVTFFSMHFDVFSPVYEGVTLADFEQTADTSKVVDKDFSEIEPGDCIGKITTQNDLMLVANAPQHQLGGVVSYKIGSAEFGKSGYVYMQTDIKNLKRLKSEISFSASGCFDKCNYVLAETKHFNSVDALMAYTPDIAKCAIIYAYDSAEIGVKSTCTALIFEEVQI